MSSLVWERLTKVWQLKESVKTSSCSRQWLLSEISDAKRVAMRNAVNRLHESRDRSLAIMKTDRFMADADWQRVETTCVINNPYTEGDDQVSFSREVILDPGETIVVQGEGSLIKQHLDSELWVCIQPTEGMRLTVSNNIEGLNVYAKANHFQELESVCNDNSTLIWMLPYGIFPYQSVTLWWECDSN